MDMKNVKGCSTYLLVKEIQINIMRCHVTSLEKQTLKHWFSRSAGMTGMMGGEQVFSHIVRV